MAIKRIPVKGISRTPSGQVTEDGMCTESLNVQLDAGEVAPMMGPRRFTNSGGQAFEVDAEVYFYHKGAGYENMIYASDSYVFYMVIKPLNSPGDQSSHTGTLFALDTGETIVDVKSVGNTLVISTNKHIHYVLWKDGAYHYLGTQIPIPELLFREKVDDGSLDRVTPVLTEEEGAFVGTVGSADFTAYVNQGEEIPVPPDDYNNLWYRLLSPYWDDKAKRYVLDTEQQRVVINKLWQKIWNQIHEAESDSKLVFPIFVRYAVRLYDGTCYAQSAPILLGAGINRFVDAVFGLSLAVYNKNADYRVEAKVATPYNIAIEFASGSSLFSGWEDIVSGIDIFISTQFVPNENAASLQSVGHRYPESPTTGAYDEYSKVLLDPYYTEEHQDEWMLQHQQTFLIKSYSLTEYQANAQTEVVLDDINVTNDWIANQEPLMESPQSMHAICGADNMAVYNKRLMLSGATIRLNPGPFQFSASEWINIASGAYKGTYTFYYYLHTQEGTRIVKSDAIENRSIWDGAYDHNELPVTMVCYPDSRCYRCDVFFEPDDDIHFDYGYATFEMKPFSSIDAAYAFFGFGNIYIDVEDVTIPTPPTEKNSYTLEQTTLIAKMNNPFVFPAEDQLAFGGKILAMAAVTTPISEGQAGQFPMYVFTDEGVYAISVNSVGKFVKGDDLVTRDVLVNKYSLCAIEQAIFFASQRGILLLQGSSVTKVSSPMDGKVQAIGTLSQTVSGEFMGGVGIDNAEVFSAFIKDCRMAYDYLNARIIVFREDSDCIYVYKISTGSWHRMIHMWEDINDDMVVSRPVRALNSFPECCIASRLPNPGYDPLDPTSQEFMNETVYDYSVLSEDTDAVPMLGFVVTRELSLDNADIYKAINRLKVRGRYADGHIKWALQGSNDGVNYRTLHSLRGPSWKWYRIAFVTLLDAGERVSYIELDYNPKFLDRMR